MLDVLDYDPIELEKMLADEFGLEAFRAKQLRSWLYKRRSRDFGEMTDISRSVREQLSSSLRIFRPVLVQRTLSRDGTKKYLMQLDCGSRVETVLIKQPTRNTLCVSSQVGCGMGCQFCRTAQMGFKRHLRAFEILGQILLVKDDIYSSPNPEENDFQNIVFMGMGEPLHNYDFVARAVRILNDDLGLFYSFRKITVSTSGLVPQIKRFGEEDLGANLAVSLNATSDEVRSKIMPINKRWNIAQLMQALREMPQRKNRHITIEYVLLKGINDTPEDLRRMPKILHGIPVKLNLIPYNKNSGLGFEPPAEQLIKHWQKELASKGINTRIRWSKGDDIDAACGQLAWINKSNSIFPDHDRGCSI